MIRSLKAIHAFPDLLGNPVQFFQRINSRKILPMFGTISACSTLLSALQARW